MTVDDALDFLMETLAGSGGLPDYFTFTVQNGNRQLLLRESVVGSRMEHEAPKLIHLCRPVSLAEAIKDNHRVAHLGFVIEGTCSRCDETFE
jgi:hypothetical protein